MIKGLAVLVIVGFASLVVYAYLGDMAPQQTDTSLPLVVPRATGATNGN